MSVQPSSSPWLDSALETGLTADVPIQPQEAARGLRSSLIVGLGEAGQWVLTHTKNNLLDRTAAWPSNVRLVLIDFQDANRDPRKRPIRFAGRSLDDGEMIILRPRFREIDDEIDGELRQIQSRWVASERSRLQENWHHRWWVGNRAGRYGRSGGRMAMFWDLQRREGGGELERRLRQALDALRDQGPLEAILVASLTDEACSGMIWDVGHLLRVLPQAQLPGMISLLLLFCPGRSEANAYQVTAAALREMSRLSYPGLVTPYHYLKGVPSDRHWLTAATDKPPFDRCYLLGDKGGGGHIDLSGIPGEWGLWPLAADVITALLDQGLGAQFDREKRNHWQRAHDERQSRQQAVVSSLGGFTFRLPASDLRRALEYRLLMEVWFGEGGEACAEGSSAEPAQSPAPVGLVRLQRERQYLQTTVSVWRRPQSDRASVDGEQEIEDFLRGQAHSPMLVSQPLWIAMVEAWRRKNWPGFPDPGLWHGAVLVGAVEAFRNNLERKLNLLLNGAPDAQDVVEAKSARFPDALGFLRRLRDVLDMGIPPLPGAWRLERHVRDGYHRLLFTAGQMIDRARDELESWARCLVPDLDLSAASASAPGGLRLSSLDIGESGNVRLTLHEILIDGLSQVRQHLHEERQVAMRETFLEQSLDRPFYHSYVRRQHLEQAMRQLVWRWEITSEHVPLLRMMVLGPRHMHLAPEQLLDYGRSYQQVTDLADDLLDLARCISRGVVEGIRLEDQMQEAVWPSRPNVAEALSAGLLSMLGIRGDGQVEVDRYGAATCWPGGGGWQDRWGKAPGTMVNQGPGGDPFSAALVEAIQWAWLENSDVWLRSVGEERESKATMFIPYSPNARWHVLPAEQAATECEGRLFGARTGRAGMLHPLFVRLLEDEDLARYFALGYLGGLVEWRETEGTYYWLPEQVPLKGMGAYDSPLLQAAEAWAVLVPWTPGAGEQLAGWRRREVLDRLDTLIRDRWRQLVEQHGSLERAREAVRQERIAPLRSEGKSRLERDLAVFLDDVLTQYMLY